MVNNLGEKMKKKTIAYTSFVGVLAITGAIYGYYSTSEDVPSTRIPASSKYESMSGCEKQEELWMNVQKTAHQTLPPYSTFGLLQILGMGRQAIHKKADFYSDFAPEGWKKYLHRRGSIAKVKIVPQTNSYTGIFEGAECALLRLSLTYRPKGSRAVAPGLALKVLRDKVPSANVSALVSLEGQEKNFNFFANPMSNIVPIGDGIGQKLVHRVFSKVTNYPEELLPYDMANFDTQGERVAEAKTPRQLFFVPKDLAFSSDEHDVREDFATIAPGTVIYQIFAAKDDLKDFDYSQYTHDKAKEFLKGAEHIADIVSTSSFVASEFGDDGIFFKHEIRQLQK